MPSSGVPLPPDIYHDPFHTCHLHASVSRSIKWKMSRGSWFVSSVLLGPFLWPQDPGQLWPSVALDMLCVLGPVIAVSVPTLLQGRSYAVEETWGKTAEGLSEAINRGGSPSPCTTGRAEVCAHVYAHVCGVPMHVPASGAMRVCVCVCVHTCFQQPQYLGCSGRICMWSGA